MEVGDRVLARDYSNKNDKWTSGQVVEKTGPVSYRINLDRGNVCRRHIDQLLPNKRNRFSVFNDGLSAGNKNEWQGSGNDERSGVSLSDWEETKEAAAPLETEGFSVTAPELAQEPELAPAGAPRDFDPPPPQLTERGKRALARSCRNKGGNENVQM